VVGLFLSRREAIPVATFAEFALMVKARRWRLSACADFEPGNLLSDDGHSQPFMRVAHAPT
jgi:hypothetical protein